MITPLRLAAWVSRSGDTPRPQKSQNESAKPHRGTPLLWRGAGVRLQSRIAISDIIKKMIGYQ
jgi:hypothetical protein